MDHSFEKLGVFYLGRQRAPESSGSVPEDVLYDAKDLTTHALCVGMTGSGKTGLCISLLEEAGIDGIPAIAIDPKGDLGNLLLTFPHLRPEDFRSWIDDAEAARHGQTPDEYAEHVARRWQEGLAQWGEDGDRIDRFRSSVDIGIYTPGSSAGLPLAVLRSFDAPSQAIIDDTDAFRQRVAGAAGGLLTLLGLDIDPVRSREFIFVSNLLDHAWREQRDLDIATLIREIQAPPFERVGVMDLDTFFPAKDRLELAMGLNNLLASPSFASWLEGEPLDIKRLLYTESGKPRISIISIAHLSDTERMFFVTILLNELLTWVRGQAGTPSLRALFYMDEVFGYFPPIANPPSKTPMLTLLKQARAYGLGIVLATQNPVDLDYKGLANCGTWFLGRLQTERDKARVLDGLEGASTQSGTHFDRQEIDRVLSGLDSRVFLMNNVHEDAPVIFETRWAMSYLRGPLTQDQIRKLTADRRKQPSDSGGLPGQTKKEDVKKEVAEPIAAASIASQPAADVPPDVPQLYVSVCRTLSPSSRLVYRPALLGSAKLHFIRATYHMDTWQQVSALQAVREDPASLAWDGAEVKMDDPWVFQAKPDLGGEFAQPPTALSVARNYKSWQQQLKKFLYQTQSLGIWNCRALKAYSEPGEAEDDFRIRLSQQAHELRDLQVEKLRKRYGSKAATLKDQIRRAQERIQKERDEYHAKTLDTVISVGSSIFGALLGRKLVSRTNVSKASSSARSIGRTARQRSDVGRAEQELAALQEKMKALEKKAEEDVAKIETAFQPDRLELESLEVRPRKSDVSIEPIALAWCPWIVDNSGIAEPAF